PQKNGSLRADLVSVHRNAKTGTRPRAFGPVSRCWPLLVSLAVSTMYSIRPRDYFNRCFGLLAPCLAARAWSFCWFAMFVCVCFCAACFCFCFGDLSPMTQSTTAAARNLRTFFHRLRFHASIGRVAPAAP